ncbi:MAG: cysteine dioxygenase family protein [Myxococcota bacterium]|nr:cysteine dioxygenase family protein [Myxococcota bacterium]
MEPTARIIDPCRALAAHQAPSLSAILEVAGQVELSGTDLDALALPDHDQPYGRRVLLADPRLEVMIATWTPGITCAPHDHGGSVGGVRVLRGRARHRIYTIRDGELVLCREHITSPGEVLSFGPNLIHSMSSEDPDTPLMTLHFYTGAIEMMLVYTESETLAVDGSCGAWVPEDPADILGRVSGVLARDDLVSRLGLHTAASPAVD